MAAYVRTSTGLETMSRMPLKPLSRICGMMLPKMEMFLFTRSRRVSPGFWAAPGGDHDHGGVGDVGVITGIDLHGIAKGHAVRDVEGLALGASAIDVDQDHLGEQAALHERESRGGTTKPQPTTATLRSFTMFTLPFPHRIDGRYSLPVLDRPRDIRHRSPNYPCV